jgi:O-antigen/teichoic acid export membrane protein
MNTLKIKHKRYAIFFGILSVASISLCFILAPLGSFVIWIFGGMTVFAIFMMIFSFIPPPKVQYKKRKLTPQEEETKAHIAFHLPLVISLLLAGLLVALIVVFFAG